MSINLKSTITFTREIQVTISGTTYNFPDPSQGDLPNQRRWYISDLVGRILNLSFNESTQRFTFINGIVSTTDEEVFIALGFHTSQYLHTDQYYLQASGVGGVTAQDEPDVDTYASTQFYNMELTKAVSDFQTYDAVTKQYVDREIEQLLSSAPTTLDTLNEIAQALSDDQSFAVTMYTMQDSLSSGISTEESRALFAENLLSSDLSTQVSSATSIEYLLSQTLSSDISQMASTDTTLSVAISREASQALSSDVSIDPVLSAEIYRASSVETTLSSALSTQIVSESLKDVSLSTAIETYASKAVDVEDSLESKLSIHTVDELSRDASLSTSLSTEISTAQKSEVSLDSRLSSDISRASSFETYYSTAIDDERVRAEAQELSIQEQLSASVSDLEAVDTQFSRSLSTQTSTAFDSESTLSTEISQESSTSVSSEQSLSTTLSEEVSSALSSERVLSRTLSLNVVDVLSLEESLSTGISQEQYQAISTDGSLSTLISTRELQATTAESSLSSDLSSEASTALFKEQSLSSSISSEAVRAQDKEASLSSDISQETSSALESEASLSTSLSKDVSKAVSSERFLSSEMSQEMSRAFYAEASLSTGISEEVSSSISVEDSLSSTLSSEAVRATTKEQALSSDVSSEVSRATSDEASISNTLSIQSSQAVSQESVISSNVSLEVVRAQDKETSLSSDISQEASLAVFQEQSLSSSISSEVSRAETKEGALSSEISSETSRAEKKEGEFSSDVSSEVSRLVSTDSSLSSSLSSEVMRAMSEETILSRNVSIEISRTVGVDLNLSLIVEAQISQSLSRDNNVLYPVILYHLSTIASNDVYQSAEIQSEITRATAQDTLLSSLIPQQISRAQSLEQSLESMYGEISSAFSSDVFQYVSSDTSITTAFSGQLSTHISSVTSMDVKLDGVLGSEISRSTSRATYLTEEAVHRSGDSMYGALSIGVSPSTEKTAYVYISDYWRLTAETNGSNIRFEYNQYGRNHPLGRWKIAVPFKQAPAIPSIILSREGGGQNTVNLNDQFTLTATAVNINSPSFIWQQTNSLNGTWVDVETQPNPTNIYTTTLSQTGMKYYRVRDDAGLIFSNIFAIEVVEPRSISLTYTESSTLNAGQLITSITSSNSGFLNTQTYQWYTVENGVYTPISGKDTAILSNYTIPFNLFNKNLSFVLVATELGISVSDAVPITIRDANISVSGGDKSIDVYEDFTLTATVSNISGGSYQWQMGTTTSTLVPIEGATGSTYTTSFNATDENQTVYYKVDIGDGNGTFESNPTSITVRDASVGVIASRSTVQIGDTVLFTASPTGIQNPTYTWYRYNSDGSGELSIAGQTQAYYSFEVPYSYDNTVYKYKSKVRGFESDFATLSIEDASVGIVGELSRTYQVGDSLMIEANAQNLSKAVEYQWYQYNSSGGNETVLPSEVSNVYDDQVSFALNNSNVKYAVKVDGALSSEFVDITVLQASLSISGGNKSVDVYEPFSLSAVATHISSDGGYQWYKSVNGSSWTEDVITPTLSYATVFEDDNQTKYYRVKLKDYPALSTDTSITVRDASVGVTASSSTAQIGDTVLFTASPTNIQNPTYTWYRYNSDGSGELSIAGQTQAYYSFEVPYSYDNTVYKYKSKVRGFESEFATLSIEDASVSASLSSPDANTTTQKTVRLGDQILLSAFTENITSPVFEWQRTISGANSWSVLSAVSGEISSTYTRTINSGDLSNTYNYKVVVNSGISSESFTIIPQQQTVTVSGTNSTLYVGETVSVSSNVSGFSGSPSYQWYIRYNDVDRAIPDQTSSSLTNYTIPLNVSDLSLSGKTVDFLVKVTPTGGSAQASTNAISITIPVAGLWPACETTRPKQEFLFEYTKNDSTVGSYTFNTAGGYQWSSKEEALRGFAYFLMNNGKTFENTSIIAPYIYDSIYKFRTNLNLTLYPDNDTVLTKTNLENGSYEYEIKILNSEYYFLLNDTNYKLEFGDSSSVMIGIWSSNYDRVWETRDEFINALTIYAKIYNKQFTYNTSNNTFTTDINLTIMYESGINGSPPYVPGNVPFASLIVMGDTIYETWYILTNPIITLSGSTYTLVFTTDISSYTPNFSVVPKP